MFGRGRADPGETAANEAVASTIQNDMVRDELNFNNGSLTESMSNFMPLIDDDKLTSYFDKESPNYCPLLKNVFSSSSRMNFLTNCTALEARSRVIALEIKIMKLKKQTKDPLMWMLLDDFCDTFKMRINDSIGGFKSRQVFTRSSNIVIDNESKYTNNNRQKKGIFGSIFG